MPSKQTSHTVRPVLAIFRFHASKEWWHLRVGMRCEGEMSTPTQKGKRRVTGRGARSYDRASVQGN